MSTLISGIDRWSATENIRISVTSSPQNSTRTGCSAVGAKDVEDAAADGELAAPTDHVHPGVGQLDQPGDDALEPAVGAGVLADGQGERFQQAQPRGHRLQQRADRGDHHPQRRAQPGVVGVGQPAQQHQPGADGVHAR